MKLAIIGTRTDALEYDFFLREICDFILEPITEIVSGGAKKGGDRLAEVLSQDLGIPVKIFPPDWKTYPRTAGFIRNTDIAEYCDELIAFWDGRSAGTADTLNKINRLNKRNKVVLI